MAETGRDQFGMRRWRGRAVAAGLAFVLSVVALPAEADHNSDQHQKMEVVFTSPNARSNSDLAFWGGHAFKGYYRNDVAVGGFRIFDISDPSRPRQLLDFPCDGPKNDPIVWDRDGNGIADLLLLAVDRTMAGPECGAARVAHDDPSGWEGVRVFELSDDPDAPFRTIEQVAAVYTDCGAQTITLWPGEAEEGRLLVYVSSYPLQAGPTCGQVRGPEAHRDPLHGVIQVLEVPLDEPAAAKEIAEPRLEYPGDPDNRIDWSERNLVGLQPGARACHEITVHVRLRLAAGACLEQGQLWRIDEDGVPDTADPVWVFDDAVTSGGTGSVPGSIDFVHSAAFSNDGSVVIWTDESLGGGCPPTTVYQTRPWNPIGGTHKTGRMFFVDGGSGSYISEFQVGDVRPEPTADCSAHMALPVANIQKDLLVNAWYMGGADVIDFTKPSRLREVAYYDIAPGGPTGSDNRSAYAYAGPNFPRGPGIPVYATEGMNNLNSGRGLVVFRANIGQVGVRSLGHLNPQTQGE